MSLYGLGLAQAAEEIREGRITSAELVADCLKRYADIDDKVQAWAFLDPAHAIKQAEAADEHRRHGRPLGPLHGVPVGIKDIFDTGDMPTEFGSPIWAGRTPRQDATAVAMLRAAGAVIMGKTVTTEYAYFSPGKTRNPHDAERTPGGSSSGSAAAVAAGVVPGAIGSQTNGSVIRPASYCGVVGFKPSHGLIPRSGALLLSRTLDHVGVFARSIADAALLAETMVGFDNEDPDTHPTARPPLSKTAIAKPPLPPRLAFAKTPAWQFAEPVTVAAFAELVDALGENVAEIELGSSFDSGIPHHNLVMDVEMAQNFHRDYEQSAAALSPVLRELIERGRNHKAIDYARAVAGARALRESLDATFDEFDAIVTPAAPGEAPRGLDRTGNPVFCTLWTYLGLPAVTLPLLASESGMPIGVQLVGRHGNDGRLLRTANWLAQTLGGKPKRGKR
jgi:Asp-tRNA(Asn)/Glu-tRNA(Gln) amidotransferase A subunit family amidase